jgi:enoyl-CoA hydratase/carnithine racemase
MIPIVPPPSAPVLNVQNGVATITLNRPAHRNRLENEDLRTLLLHFATVNQDPLVRVLVLTAHTDGQPRPVFCAGYDIGSFGEADPHAVAFEQVPEALAAMRPITICGLNGSVYGGATDLVLACDLRLGLQGAEWRMPAAALGLHYYPSGLQRYLRLFGESAAKRAFLTARTFNTQQLAQLGIFEEFVGADEWALKLSALIQEVKGLAPLAAQETKKSLNELASGHVNAKALASRQELTKQSADFAERRQAFLERRKPVFKGL